MKIKMTDQVLVKLKPAQSRIDIADTVVTNLMMTVQPKGKKVWSVRYRADGKRVKMKLGEYPDLSLRDAREQARDAILSVFDGENPAYDKTQEKLAKTESRVGSTISSLLERYDALHLSQLKTGYQAHTFLREFVARYGKLNILEFKRQHFVDLIDEIMLQGNGTKANRVHTHVKTFFNWAIGRGYVEHNPCDRVPKPYKEKSRERFLSDKEIEWFWIATGEDLEPFGHLARLLLLTGQRLNECAKMTEGELIGRDHWHLSSARTKNGNQHDVFLSPMAQSIVWREARVAGEFIFSTIGIAPVQSFDKPVKRLRARMNELAGRELEHFTFHDLRRTCETGLAMLETPQPIIDRITNHITGRGMARVYNMHDYRAEKAAALQKWADHIEGLVR